MPPPNPNTPGQSVHVPPKAQPGAFAQSNLSPKDAAVIMDCLRQYNTLVAMMRTLPGQIAKIESSTTHIVQTESQSVRNHVTAEMNKLHALLDEHVNAILTEASRPKGHERIVPYLIVIIVLLGLVLLKLFIFSGGTPC